MLSLPRHRSRLNVEQFEDRTTPTASTLSANFNSTPIAPGDAIWFNSAATVSGLITSATTLTVTDGAVSFSANGRHYSVDIPDTTISFTMLATSATVTYTNGGWLVTAPPAFSGNIFTGGAGMTVPSSPGLLGGLLGSLGLGGIPGNVSNVQWSANFSADRPELTVNWQWSAAVYNQFSSGLGNLGVKAVDDASVDLYRNADRAGTPEAFKQHVKAGARGAGGTNYTGNYSASASVSPTVTQQEPSVLSGRIVLDTNGDQTIDSSDNGLSGMEVILTGFDAHGAVNRSVFTDENGVYSFADLQPGTYSIQMVVPQTNYTNMFPQVGSTGGNIDASWTGFTDIELVGGDTGVGYNMGVYESST